MTMMTTPTAGLFPDRPMSEKEVSASLRGELNRPLQVFYIDESWHRTERVSVEAFDEADAWKRYEKSTNRWEFSVRTLYEDACVDAEMTGPDGTTP